MHVPSFEKKSRNSLSLELCLSMPEIAATAICSGENKTEVVPEYA
jgi:hypothetical protein